MKKFVLVIVIIQFYAVIAHCQNENISFRNSISSDATYFNGYLKDIGFDVYINYGRLLYTTEDFELRGKIGMGLRMIGVEPDLLSSQISIESYFGNKPGKFFTGLGLLNTIGVGTHVPLIVGYNYTFSKKFSFYFQIDPIIWYTDISFDGHDNEERFNYWIWNDDGYTNYQIKAGIRFNFNFKH